MPHRAPRVLVTRSPRQASTLADRLRALGAEPVLIPTIETVDPRTFEVLDAALEDLSSFDWLLFTSANAVEAFARRLAGPVSSPQGERTQREVDPRSLGEMLEETASPSGSLPAKTAVSTGAPQPVETPWPDSRRPSLPRVAAIGVATARALDARGLGVDLVPPQAVAESFTEALLPHARHRNGSATRFLLLRAEDAREHLPETLRGAGADVTVAPAYRTVVPAGSAARLREALTGPGAVQAVTFTSSSTARNLFALLAEAACELPAHVVRASIGPITSATLQELGFPPNVESSEATTESLAQSLVKYLQGNIKAYKHLR